MFTFHVFYIFMKTKIQIHLVISQIFCTFANKIQRALFTHEEILYLSAGGSRRCDRRVDVPGHRRAGVW